MPGIERFAFRLAAFTAAIIALVFALVLMSMVLAFGIRAVFPQPGHALDEPTVVDAVVNWAYGGDTFGPPKGQPETELMAARVNHDAIESWIERCTAKLLLDPVNRTYVKDSFGRNGEEYANSASNRLTQQTILPVARELGLLSTSIVRGRADNALTAAKAYTTLQVSTWAAILLGLATTVLVSLGATEFGKGESRTARTIRILAIIFPALGTAAAAVTAFYAPREDLARSSQALASFRQVHDQIASELGPLNCPAPRDAAANKEMAARVADWKKSLKDARSVAEAAALAAVDPARGQGQGQAGSRNGGSENPQGK